MEKSRAVELLKLAVPIKALTQQEYADFVEAVNMGMDALEQPEERTEKRTETHACNLISRQAAIDAIANCTNCGDEKTLRAYVAKHSLDNGWTGGVLEAIDAIKDLPSAQPERTEERTETHGVCLDAISRQEALDALDCINGVEEVLRSLPPEQPDLNEWRTGCREYDKERHSCPRWNRVIRQTVEDMKAAQPEPQWISVTERLPDNADHPGAFCPRYHVATPYGVTEGWYRPHDHEKGGQWFALFWFMSQTYEIWNIDFERGDVPKVIGEAPVMAWRPLPERYQKGVKD